ncbi:aminodeoxychorismate/anthranilate synthase component II [Candidatus Solincola tengchongensis]|uniref:anthranilate synthase component II n=1 Tax=Candidatus Solincola tengchongensis TaxID=2900693 RepID=UPI0025803079|nr:aminodeoxychorismate/anthranilate synthase component II [Candidatus Solincola tengchongensis]
MPEGEDSLSERGDRTARVVLIDNYDSFTFNLAQALQVLGAEVIAVRNDELTPSGVEELRPTHLVISPGPGGPEDTGVTIPAVRKLAGRVPVLGVCLGHQAIAYLYGAPVIRAPRPVHGKTSSIFHDGRTIYRGLPNPFTATRYHSLMVDPGLSPELEVSARSEDGLVMGIRHRFLPVEGVQFHPESFLTEAGADLLRNFLGMEVGR